MRELEVKLSVDDPFVTPSLTATAAGIAGMSELPTVDLRATYYDTADLRLARCGVTLRFRSGEAHQSQWTLKLPTTAESSAIARDELNFEGTARRVPEAARELVTAFVRSGELQPVTRLRTRRRRWSLQSSDGDELAELVDDRVAVLQRNRIVARFRELEIEARRLDGPELEEIASVLRRAGAAPTATPKALRALGTRALAPPDIVVPENISPSDPAAFAVQAAIARSLIRITFNDPGTRLGDPEALHQMRVGTRRMRSDLHTFGSLVDPEWSRSLAGELRRLGGVLGEVRDLDVLSKRLNRSARDLEPSLDELFGQLNERRNGAREQLIGALRAADYVELLDRLVDAARDPALAADAWRPCGEVLPPLAASAARKLVRAGQRLAPDSPDGDYPRVRKLAKRSRYAAEAIAPAVGSRGAEAERYARRARRVQEVLGDLQDTTVACELIEAFASGRGADGRASFAAGRLLERQHQDARRARQRFPKTWKRLKRDRPASWIDGE